VTPRARLIRRLSLVLLLLWVGVLALSFARRQLERRPTVGQMELGGGVEKGSEQPVRVHKGFVYTDTVGVEPSFRVSARETVQFASGWYELSDVEVWLYHEGEVAYGLTAKHARFNPARREALARGDVQVSLRGGIALQAASFSLHGPERTLESQGTVTFAGPGFGGVAGGVICSLSENTVELVGGLSVTWRQEAKSGESLVLLATRLKYFRKQALIRLPEGVTLLRGPLRLRAGPTDVQLVESEGALRKATFGAPVEVDGTMASGATITGEAGSMEIEALDGGRYRVTAAPAADLGWVRGTWHDPLEGWREFTFWRFVAEGLPSAWDWLEGQGRACLTEVPPREEARHLASQRLRLTFQSGKPATVVADETVHLSSGGQWADGDEFSYSMPAKTFALTPASGQRVKMGNAEVDCEAGQLESGKNGEVVARGHVNGVLRRGSPWGAGGGPVRFAADSITMVPGGSTLVLEGDARLWQGDRILRADRLEYQRDHQVVIGQGSVVTIAHLAGGEGGGGRVELHARSMEYQRLAGTTSYEGDVTLADPRSLTQCQHLLVTLGPDGAVELATLEGGVKIRELQTQRVITGQRARFNVASDVLDIWGTPVLLQEPNGDQVKGNHLRWRRATSTITVVGNEDNPSETIYHFAPEGPTPVPTRRPS
jgi:lipopolysaccharide export system protein LptA